MKRIVVILLCMAFLLGIAGCGAEDGLTASVQKVSEIMGVGAVGLSNRYSGVTVASVEEKIYKDENGTVAECAVQAGDHVQAGDLLFSYDMEAMELNLEKARLEIARIENTISGLEDQLQNLKEEKERASASQQLSYTLEIQSTETNIREETYNLGVKQKALEQMEASVGEAEVRSPISGRIQNVNDEGGFDENGKAKPYITVLDTSSFRVEGTVNEMNVRALYEGMPVLLRSRVSDDTWTGVISLIDYDNPVQNQNNYYGEDTSASSSKYHFYVEPESSEGLMLGQHVYIELDNGIEEEESGVMLPEYYLNDVDGDSAWVWAASSRNTLEKRNVKLGQYREELGAYPILDGLTLEDRVAFPDENWKTGMKVAEDVAVSAE
ncbi:MAG: efflux RND transporter periplasmic adaptor subunit [Firmicutes bacterium]|nr:efflux RND transporter periplasmic adaptor subunit [Bacillota bacterium]